MIDQTDAERGRAVLARFSTLAEQRLDHFAELFETGRWRRYFSEMDFLDNIREVKEAVATWHRLVAMEATADNRPVDWSWLGRERRALPKTQVPAPPRLAETATPIAVVAVAPALAVDTPTAAPEVLDLESIEQRYPILHAVLQSTDAVRAA